MRLGAFEAARAEFLLAADSGSGSLDAGGTAAEARRLAGDAARAAALVDDLTRVDGGALATLRRHSVDGASVGARRVKTNAFLAAEGNGGTNSDDADDKDASSSSRSVAATARGVLRSVRDISAVAPHCAAVAEAKARALLWEGRFADAATAADAEGLGGAAHRIKKSGGAKSGDASLADASPRAFCFETGGEAWRARVRFLARFATGDLAGAVEASGVESSGDGFGDDGDIPARDRKAGRGGAEENDETDAKKKNTEASVMNDDASLVASRVADEIESAEKSIFVSLLRAATEAHALRVQGNASFKAKKYERAAETYTAALEALSTAPGGALSAAFCSVCLCNRAAAAHALGRVADALADCGRALALNPARIKSLSRRAQLYAETRMHDAAADDLQRLLATLALGTETKRDAERGGSVIRRGAPRGRRGGRRGPVVPRLRGVQRRGHGASARGARGGSREDHARPRRRARPRFGSSARSLVRCARAFRFGREEGVPPPGAQAPPGQVVRRFARLGGRRGASPRRGRRVQAGGRGARRAGERREAARVRRRRPQSPVRE
jgi:tetratricopeptide (TPR) repeat protein